jgi:hypothetical protein
MAVMKEPVILALVNLPMVGQRAERQLVASQDAVVRNSIVSFSMASKM